MADLISVGTTLGVLGLGLVIIIKSSDTQKDEIKRILEIREDRKNELKKGEKRRFINNFIDEIPELSYYEAAQLKKKLGNIYLEWNDE